MFAFGNYFINQPYAAAVGYTIYAVVEAAPHFLPDYNTAAEKLKSVASNFGASGTSSTASNILVDETTIVILNKTPKLQEIETTSAQIDKPDSRADERSFLYSDTPVITRESSTILSVIIGETTPVIADETPQPPEIVTTSEKADHGAFGGNENSPMYSDIFEHSYTTPSVVDETTTAIVDEPRKSPEAEIASDRVEPPGPSGVNSSSVTPDTSEPPSTTPQIIDDKITVIGTETSTLSKAEANDARADTSDQHELESGNNNGEEKSIFNDNVVDAFAIGNSLIAIQSCTGPLVAPPHRPALSLTPSEAPQPSNSDDTEHLRGTVAPPSYSELIDVVEATIRLLALFVYIPLMLLDFDRCFFQDRGDYKHYFRAAVCTFYALVVAWLAYCNVPLGVPTELWQPAHAVIAVSRFLLVYIPMSLRKLTGLEPTSIYHSWRIMTRTIVALLVQSLYFGYVVLVNIFNYKILGPWHMWWFVQAIMVVTNLWIMWTAKYAQDLVIPLIVQGGLRMWLWCYQSENYARNCVSNIARQTRRAFRSSMACAGNIIDRAKGWLILYAIIVYVICAPDALNLRSHGTWPAFPSRVTMDGYFDWPRFNSMVTNVNLHDRWSLATTAITDILTNWYQKRHDTKDVAKFGAQYLLWVYTNPCGSWADVKYYFDEAVRAIPVDNLFIRVSLVLLLLCKDCLQEIIAAVVAAILAYRLFCAYRPFDTAAGKEPDHDGEARKAHKFSFSGIIGAYPDYDGSDHQSDDVEDIVDPPGAKPRVLGETSKEVPIESTPVSTSTKGPSLQKPDTPVKDRKQEKENKKRRSEAKASRIKSKQLLKGNKLSSKPAAPPSPLEAVFNTQLSAMQAQLDKNEQKRKEKYYQQIGQVEAQSGRLNQSAAYTLLIEELGGSDPTVEDVPEEKAGGAQFSVPIEQASVSSDPPHSPGLRVPDSNVSSIQLCEGDEKSDKKPDINLPANEPDTRFEDEKPVVQEPLPSITALEPEAQTSGVSPARTTFARRTSLNLDDLPLPSLYNRPQVNRPATGVDSKEEWRNGILVGPSLLTQMRQEQEAAGNNGSNGPTNDPIRSDGGSSGPPPFPPPAHPAKGTCLNGDEDKNGSIRNAPSDGPTDGPTDKSDANSKPSTDKKDGDNDGSSKPNGGGAPIAAFMAAPITANADDGDIAMEDATEVNDLEVLGDADKPIIDRSAEDAMEVVSEDDPPASPPTASFGDIDMDDTPADAAAVNTSAAQGQQASVIRNPPPIDTKLAEVLAGLAAAASNQSAQNAQASNTTHPAVPQPSHAATIQSVWLQAQQTLPTFDTIPLPVTPTAPVLPPQPAALPTPLVTQFQQPIAFPQLNTTQQPPQQEAFPALYTPALPKISTQPIALYTPDTADTLDTLDTPMAPVAPVASVNPAVPDTKLQDIAKPMPLFSHLKLLDSASTPSAIVQPWSGNFGTANPFNFPINKASSAQPTPSTQSVSSSQPVTASPPLAASEPMTKSRPTLVSVTSSSAPQNSQNETKSAPEKSARPDLAVEDKGDDKFSDVSSLDVEALQDMTEGEKMLANAVSAKAKEEPLNAGTMPPAESDQDFEDTMNAALNASFDNVAEAGRVKANVKAGLSEEFVDSDDELSNVPDDLSDQDSSEDERSRPKKKTDADDKKADEWNGTQRAPKASAATMAKKGASTQNTPTTDAFPSTDKKAGDTAKSQKVKPGLNAGLSEGFLKAWQSGLHIDEPATKASAVRMAQRKVATLKKGVSTQNTPTTDTFPLTASGPSGLNSSTEITPRASSFPASYVQGPTFGAPKANAPRPFVPAKAFAPLGPRPSYSTAARSFQTPNVSKKGPSDLGISFDKQYGPGTSPYKNPRDDPHLKIKPITYQPMAPGRTIPPVTVPHPFTLEGSSIQDPVIEDTVIQNSVIENPVVEEPSTQDPPALSPRPNGPEVGDFRASNSGQHFEVTKLPHSKTGEVGFPHSNGWVKWKKEKNEWVDADNEHDLGDKYHRISELEYNSAFVPPSFQDPNPAPQRRNNDPASSTTTQTTQTTPNPIRTKARSDYDSNDSDNQFVVKYGQKH